MRISDWSSDVCSSDLQELQALADFLEDLVGNFAPAPGEFQAAEVVGSVANRQVGHRRQGFLTDPHMPRLPTQTGTTAVGAGLDRKSVVSGKSVAVRVDLGGRRIIKKKKNHINN